MDASYQLCTSGQGDFFFSHILRVESTAVGIVSFFKVQPLILDRIEIQIRPLQDCCL